VIENIVFQVRKKKTAGRRGGGADKQFDQNIDSMSVKRKNFLDIENVIGHIHVVE
jgi:hypothetical protein